MFAQTTTAFNTLSFLNTITHRGRHAARRGCVGVEIPTLLQRVLRVLTDIITMNQPQTVAWVAEHLAVSTKALQTMARNQYGPILAAADLAPSAWCRILGQPVPACVAPTFEEQEPCTDGSDQPGMQPDMDEAPLDLTPLSAEQTANLAWLMPQVVEQAVHPLASLFGNMPVATTAKGLRIANFSSPHSFNFTDGTVLDACEKGWSQATMMEITEHVVRPRGRECVKFETVELVTKLSLTVQEAVEAALWAQEQGLVDVVIMPLMVLTQVKHAFDTDQYHWCQDRSIQASPFRTIRVADRVSKAVHPDRFCI